MGARACLAWAAQVNLYAHRAERGGVARRPLTLVASVLLIAGTLGVSTALVDEVREEVVNAAPNEPSYDFDDRQGAAGLPVREFTLLDPAPAELPERTTDGHTITLDANGTIHLDRGDAIQIAPFALPVEAAGVFPDGAEVTGSRIHCTTGCGIDAPQRTFQIPPNGTLELPGTDPLPVEGDIAPGQRLALPAGTQVHLDPIEMHASTPLPLTPGSTITLPPSEPAPPSSLEASTVQLPAQTHVRGPQGEEAVQDTRDLAAGGPELPANATGLRALKPIVEITEWPLSIRKGQPFQVTGTVELPSGDPLPEHPITLYANASERHAGIEIQIGQVTTDDAGRFSATARLPEDQPTQPYALVAEAHARSSHDPPLIASYSDPRTVPVEGTSQISLELPTQEGIQVPLPIPVRLVDGFGEPMPNRTVTATVPDDAWTGSAVTDENGRATIVAKDGLPRPGDWTVEARFDGTTYVDPDTATTTIEGVQSRIVTPPTLVVPRGGQTNLTGEVLRDDAPAQGAQITGTMGPLDLTTTTDANGSFTLPIDAPATLPIGNYSLELTTDGVTATRTVIATVTGQARLHTDPPDALPRGGTLPLVLHATTEDGESLPRFPVEAVLPGDRYRRALTDEDGRAVLPIPLDRSPLPVTLSTPGTPLVSPTTRSLTLTPGPLEIAGDLAATLGEPHEASLELTAGGPLAGERFHLAGPGIDVDATTDEDGRSQLELEAAPGTPPGAHQARLDLPRFNVLKSVPLNVLTTPELALDVLSQGDEGDPVRLRVSATGHEGPIADLPVTVTAEGAFEARSTALTGENGTAVLTLPRPSDAEGQTWFTARADRTSDTAAATTSATTTVTAAPFPWWTLLGLIPVAGAVVAYARHRRRSHLPDTEAPDGPTLKLRLAQQAGSMGPVWHPDDPATLELVLTDEDGHPLDERTVQLEGPHGRRMIKTGDDGRARVRLPPHQAGRHAYTARFDGDPLHAATEATLEIRIVDYREEIDREYQALQREATDAGLCGPDATPRELADALGGSSEAHQLARLFERCDYSPRPVERTHYERFMRAKEACRPDGQGSDA